MAPALLDLSALPEPRRVPVLEAFQREAAAARIPEVFARAMQRARLRDVAYRETAERVNHEMRLPTQPGGWAVSPRYVQAVMREGR